MLFPAPRSTTFVRFHPLLYALTYFHMSEASEFSEDSVHLISSKSLAALRK